MTKIAVEAYVSTRGSEPSDAPSWTSPAKRRPARLLAAAVSLLGASLVTTNAQAGSPALFHSGLWTFAAPYTASVIVASVSPRPVDNALYIPIAGPFIDFARRECDGCKYETLNRVLLIGDGVLQSIGALELVASLVFFGRDQYVAMEKPTPTVTFTPAQFASGGYGLMALGRF